MMHFVPKIPESHKQEFLEHQAEVMSLSVRVLCVAVAALFTIAIGFSLLINTVISPSRRLVFEGFTLAGCVIAYLLTPAKASLARSTVTGYLLTVLSLFVIVMAPPNNPESYSYAGCMLAMMTFVLFLPWPLVHTFVILMLHMFAWMMYYISRNYSHIVLPATLFGSDPLINGLSFLSITALLCLIMRVYQNRQDAIGFLLLKDVESRKAQMESELEFAARVHDTLLPHSFSDPRADVFISYRPAGYLGGDYAQFHRSNDTHLTFMIGDVTGHGVPAALLVNRLDVEFDRVAARQSSPGRLLKKLNEFISHDFAGTHMYLSAFCGTIDFENQKIQYSNYGHPSQMMFRVCKGETLPLDPQTTWLGMSGTNGHLYESEIAFEEGDLLFLFTDGVTETRSKKGELFGASRLKEFLAARAGEELSGLHADLMEELADFGGHEFTDDIFLISLRPKAFKPGGVR